VLLTVACLCLLGAGHARASGHGGAATHVAMSVDELMPQPAETRRCAGRVAVPEVVHYALSLDPAASGRFVRALERLAADTGIPFREGEPARMQVTIDSPGPTYPQLETDESYRLDIDETGIRLSAANVYGAMHGLTTLGQLVGGDSTLECVSIVDRPRYRWRGLMIDAVRHWIPLDVLRRQIDAMARYKMNVLHWHLSDDQGFRVESLGHPALHLRGSDGRYYSQAQVRALVEYAADRGVRVVPEFDLPGHSRSWQIAYPQLSSVPGKAYYLYHQEGLFSDPLDPTRAENMALIEAVVQEMSALFPDAYFHLGGDEVDTDAWEDNRRIQDFIEKNGLEDERGLHRWFIDGYAAILRDVGRIPVGWDEVAGEHLAPDVVVNKWRTREYSAAEKRNPVVLSAGFYLDYMQSAWRHYRNDPEALPDAAGAHVLGGEACAWGESMDAYTVDTRVWPRTLAIAELLWSPRELTAAASEPGFYRRLDAHSERLERMGLRHEGHAEQWFAQLLGAANARPVVTLASVSRPEPFAFLVTSWRRIVPLPWDRTIRDEPLPLSPFVDHLAPESVAARRFDEAVARYLQSRGAADRDYLRSQLQRWSGNHADLLVAIAASPQLRDAGVAELSAALKELADAGLAALAALEAGTTLRGAREADVVDAYAFVDPDLSFAWLRGNVLQWRNLFRSPIFVQVKLPVQRGIARLVEAAGAR